MKIGYKDLARAQAEITIELSPEEYEPYLKKAALLISENIKISGFRPGKAPYNVIRGEVGEGKIWEEAFEAAVKKTLFSVFKEKDIMTVGSPKIDIIKLVPGNPVAYKAIVNLLPVVKKLTLDVSKVERKKISVAQNELEGSIRDLQKLRGKEKLVVREVREGDKVEVDFKIFQDNVPLEGGDGKKMPVVVGENKFIPGFEEKLIGAKAGDEKEFQLTFPKNYYQKNVAGKLVDFKVKIFSVYEIELPKLDDEFAKGFNFETFEMLKNQIRDNLLLQMQLKEEKRVEDGIIHALVEKNKFSDIPDILVQSESQSMLGELERGIQEDGLNFEDYLTHIKKTRKDLLLEFTPIAVQRIKVAILLRKIVQQYNISATEEEIQKSVQEEILKYSQSGSSADAEKNKEFIDYVKNAVTSKKVLDFLKQKLVN